MRIFCLSLEKLDNFRLQPIRDERSINTPLGFAAVEGKERMTLSSKSRCRPYPLLLTLFGLLAIMHVLFIIYELSMTKSTHVLTVFWPPEIATQVGMDQGSVVGRDHTGIPVLGCKSRDLFTCYLLVQTFRDPVGTGITFRD